jgi:hypothetical protein
MVVVLDASPLTLMLYLPLFFGAVAGAVGPESLLLAVTRSALVVACQFSVPANVADGLTQLMQIAVDRSDGLEVVEVELLGHGLLSMQLDCCIKSRFLDF